VTLKVLVTREGRASTVNVEKSSGYPNLDQHAREAVRRWRFAPARQGNETVEQWMTVNVDY
jgi:protein TonB